MISILPYIVVVCPLINEGEATKVLAMLMWHLLTAIPLVQVWDGVSAFLRQGLMYMTGPAPALIMIAVYTWIIGNGHCHILCMGARSSCRILVEWQLGGVGALSTLVSPAQPGFPAT